MSDKPAPSPFSDKELNPFRPLDTLDDALRAQRAPVGIAAVILIGNVISLLVMAAQAENGIPTEQIIGAGGFVAIAALLGIWVWLRRSLVAGILLAGLYVVIQLSAFIATGRLPIGLMAILFHYIVFTCATLGIRGHEAARAFRMSGLNDPEVFD